MLKYLVNDKGPFTKDVRLTPGEGGLRNPDVQLSFECDSIVLSGRRGEEGSRNPGFIQTSYVNGPIPLGSRKVSGTGQ